VTDATGLESAARFVWDHLVANGEPVNPAQPRGRAAVRWAPGPQRPVWAICCRSCLDLANAQRNGAAALGVNHLLPYTAAAACLLAAGLLRAARTE
jgi:hypothetical protein